MQCPQCRRPNDHNARFCVQCGARVRVSACASCGETLPVTARFCPECGTKAPEGTPRDRADALLSVRDVDGVELEPPAPEEAELFELIQQDGARRRTVRRSLIVAGVAVLVLVAALALGMRGPRSSRPANTPAESDPAPAREAAVPAPPSTTSAPAETAPADATPPRPADTVKRDASSRVAAPEAQDVAAALPPRDARASARPDEPAEGASRPEPAVVPQTAARPAMRVDVAQTPGDGAVDYTVRVTRPDGAPVTGADVRLRGVMNNGSIVEARLDPAPEPGVYKSLLAFSERGPRALTLRVARADGVLEMPIADPGGGASRP